MTANSYDLGTAVTLIGTFTNLQGQPTDPASVTLRVLDPTGTETIVNTGQMTHGSAGNFSFVVTPLLAGVWYYRWEGTGAVVATQDNWFEVRKTPFVDAA
jgi:hypothetical protein